ncbi:Nuclear hormone receptor family member nhr-19 [Aphelenchoides avenae]|nr:Nuclear hormone receptor family member nhr-19 [Aphelenchus avenae]
MTCTTSVPPQKRRSPLEQSDSFESGERLWTSLNPELLDLMNQLTDIEKAFRARKFELFARFGTTSFLSKDLRAIANTQSSKCVSSGDLADITGIEMLMLQEWATTLPGCSILPSSDQKALLKCCSPLHLIIDQGFYTAQSGADDAWFVSNAASMPDVQSLIGDMPLPDEERMRLERLYDTMLTRCISEVAIPFRRLRLSSEELLALKMILLYNCARQGEKTVSEDSTGAVVEWRNRVIGALFHFYHSVHYHGFEERFGDVVLAISGILSAAAAQLEFYEALHRNKLVPFDKVTRALLFGES